MNFSLVFKKFVGALFISATILPALTFIVIPKRAEATIVEDFMDVGFDIESMFESIFQSAKQVVIAAESEIIATETTLTEIATSYYVWVKELSLDQIAYAMKIMLKRKMAQMMIQYVQQGFGGGPSYITNYGDYYYDTGNRATQLYFSEVGRIRSFTDPASLVDRILARAEQRLEEDTYRQHEAQLLLNEGDMEFPGQTTQSYGRYMNDFNSCPTGNGWDCWIAMSDEKNDQREVYRVMQNELARRQNVALQYAQQESSNASGFRTVRTCANAIMRNNVEYCTKYLTSIPGRIIVDQIQKYMSTHLDDLSEVDEINEIVAAALIELGTSWMTDGKLSM